MYNFEYLSMDMHALKINWLREQLSIIPRIAITTKNGREVVYIYSQTTQNANRRFERSLNGEEGRYYARLFNKRKEYESELAELMDVWKHVYKIPVPKISICAENKSKQGVEIYGDMNSDYFESLVSNDNDYPKDKWNEFDGINFRSLQERTIAEVIKGLNWPYKYEATITDGAYKLSCDFVFLVRELNQTKLFEFFGMMDNESYANKAYNKMKIYQSMGFAIDKDIFFMFASSKDSINAKMVAAKINSVIFGFI